MSNGFNVDHSDSNTNNSATNKAGSSGGQTTALATGGGDKAALDASWRKIRTYLKANLTEEVYNSWFSSLEAVSFDGTELTTSVPVKFLQTWIKSHYADELLRCCAMELKGIERIEILLRQPKPVAARPGAGNELGGRSASSETSNPPSDGRVPARPSQMQAGGMRGLSGMSDGSPLDPRYTFDSFVVGSANRMAHAGAIQVAETVLNDDRSINPLYFHASVGLGKTHLLQAIAWDVRRRAPHAQVIYITAERFLTQFVDSLGRHDATAFKDRYRSADIVLIDDLEFLKGDKTEQELDHIINALLDGGRQLVVAASRPPSQIERLNERMRSRLGRGLVTEIQPPDHELRLRIVEKRILDKRGIDPSFDLTRDVIELLAERLTESGRALEGAVTRLHFHWQTVRGTITAETTETIIRDLLQGIEPRRTKIEDILRTVTRHFGVSKGDILSQRRHRSVVWPRQIGMYLAKQLTARSLPEIGRRFGNRDHTTVLHAIRKIEGEIGGNPRLKDEIEELKKQLGHG